MIITSGHLEPRGDEAEADGQQDETPQYALAEAE